MLVKFLAGVDEGWLITIIAVKETYDVTQIVHPKNNEIINDSSFSGIFCRHNESLELIFLGTDSYRKNTAYWFEFAIKTQFAYHHIIRQQILVHLSMSSKYSNS